MKSVSKKTASSAAVTSGKCIARSPQDTSPGNKTDISNTTRIDPSIPGLGARSSLTPTSYSPAATPHSATPLGAKGHVQDPNHPAQRFVYFRNCIDSLTKHLTEHTDFANAVQTGDTSTAARTAVLTMTTCLKHMTPLLHIIKGDTMFPFGAAPPDTTLESVKIGQINNIKVPQGHGKRRFQWPSEGATCAVSGAGTAPSHAGAPAQSHSNSLQGVQTPAAQDEDGPAEWYTSVIPAWSNRVHGEYVQYLDSPSQPTIYQITRYIRKELISFEMALPWDAVKPQFRKQRAAWVKQVKTSSSIPSIARCMIKLWYQLNQAWPAPVMPDGWGPSLRFMELQRSDTGEPPGPCDEYAELLHVLWDDMKRVCSSWIVTNIESADQAASTRGGAAAGAGRDSAADRGVAAEQSAASGQRLNRLFDYLESMLTNGGSSQAEYELLCCQAPIGPICQNLSTLELAIKEAQKSVQCWEAVEQECARASARTITTNDANNRAAHLATTPAKTHTKPVVSPFITSATSPYGATSTDYTTTKRARDPSPATSVPESDVSSQGKQYMVDVAVQTQHPPSPRFSGKRSRHCAQLMGGDIVLPVSTVRWSSGVNQAVGL